MIVRDLHSLNALGEPLPGKVCHRAFADIEVKQGNHAVARNGAALDTTPALITILHFPMRSYGQFANKISKGGGAYARNASLAPGLGATWRHLYELWQRGELERYYQKSLVDDETVKTGLRDGRLVFDERLKIALKRRSKFN